MNNISIPMNIYYNPDNMHNFAKDLKATVLARLQENDCQDLYNGIEQIENEKIFDIIEIFIKNTNFDKLSKLITVDETSLKFDKGETLECELNWLAYTVNITLDIKTILNSVYSV